MPYADPFDVDTPTGANFVYQGDDRLRELKRALDQRLSSFFENWPDGEPLAPLASLIPSEVSSGTLAARPNPPTKANLVYFTDDTDQMFWSKSDGGAGFEWVESKPTQISEIPVFLISAGEARFKPNEDDTSATRVKNAITTAKLSSSPVKVVFVPKSFWGYAANPDYDPDMYDPTILLVREGSMVGWLDPVAYGADPTGAVNAQHQVDICFEHAELIALGGSNAPIVSQIVAFTVPGTYTLNTDVDRRGMAYIVWPGVEISGAGELTGDYVWKWPDNTTFSSGTLAARPAAGQKDGEAYLATDQVPVELHVWNTVPTPDAWQVFQGVDVDGYAYNAEAAGTKATRQKPVKVLHIHAFRGGSGSDVTVISLSDAGFPAGKYVAANIVSCVASLRRSATQSIEFLPVVIDTGANTISLDLDGGGQPSNWDLVIAFSA